MQLRKYHGLGNDFLILLDRDGTQPVDGEVARALCERHTGVGADGLIRVTDQPVTMDLYNADGSRAETSGNGLRCVARAVVDAGWQTWTGRPFTITTDAGPRRATVRQDGTVSVEMGTATVDGQHVDLGNPHAVVFVDDLAEADTVPPQPDLNVEFVMVGPATDELTMRVFERGVGETQACGSGASAAAAVAYAKGLVGGTVTVHQPGGAVAVALGDPIVLTGPVEFVFEAEVPAWP